MIIEDSSLYLSVIFHYTGKFSASGTFLKERVKIKAKLNCFQNQIEIQTILPML